MPQEQSPPEKVPLVNSRQNSVLSEQQPYNRSVLMTSLARVIRSDEPISLVVQGGGMRGTYSCGVMAELERMGLTSRFEHLWATSAGAINGSYFLSRQAANGVDVYTDQMSTKEFIDFRRFGRGKTIDIDFLADKIIADRVRIDEEALKNSKTELHIGTTSVKSGKIAWHDYQKSLFSIIEILRATAALPVFYGREVRLGDDSHVDGGIEHSVPLRDALAAKPKNLLVVLTRPRSYSPSMPTAMETRITRWAANMKRHSPSIVNSLGLFNDQLHMAMNTIRMGRCDDSQTKIWTISPSESIVSRLTRDRKRLIHAGQLAGHDTRVAFGEA